MNAFENQIFDFVTSGTIRCSEAAGLILSRFEPVVERKFSGNQYMFGPERKIQIKPLNLIDGILRTQKIVDGLYYVLVEEMVDVGRRSERKYLVATPVMNVCENGQTVKKQENFKVAIAMECPRMGRKLHCVQLDFSGDGENQTMTLLEIEDVGVVEKIGTNLAYVRDAKSWLEYIVSYHGK